MADSTWSYDSWTFPWARNVTKMPWMGGACSANSFWSERIFVCSGCVFSKHAFTPPEEGCQRPKGPFLQKCPKLSQPLPCTCCVSVMLTEVKLFFFFFFIVVKTTSHFPSLPFLNLQFCGLKYFHGVVQPLPPSSSRTFLLQTETH
jgi:hypothetical protein